MNNFIEQNLNQGEHIEIELQHSRLIILQVCIKLVIGLVLAIVLNILAIKAITWLNNAINKNGDLNWLIKVLSIGKGVIIFGGFAIVDVLIPLSTVLDVFSTRLAITNRRIIGKWGVFSTHTLDYPIEKIDNVTVNTTFFGKLFHHSTITVKSTNDDVGVEFECVTNANEFKNKITEAIAKNEDDARKAQAAEIAIAMKTTEDTNR